MKIHVTLRNIIFPHFYRWKTLKGAHNILWHVSIGRRVLTDTQELIFLEKFHRTLFISSGNRILRIHTCLRENSHRIVWNLWWISRIRLFFGIKGIISSFFLKEKNKFILKLLTKILFFLYGITETRKLSYFFPPLIMLSKLAYMHIDSNSYHMYLLPLITISIVEFVYNMERYKKKSTRFNFYYNLLLHDLTSTLWKNDF